MSSFRTTRVIALVHANGHLVGIEGRHVVRAVVVPDDLGRVPRGAGGIEGVMRHAGRAVPVVRLQRWLRSCAAAADGEAATADATMTTESPIAAPIAAPVDPTGPDARIVVLRDGVREVGLLVEAVVGMKSCPADAISRLFHDDRPDELFARAVLLDPAEPPVALLEPVRLAALCKVWAEHAGLDADDMEDADAAESAAHESAEPLSPGSRASVSGGSGRADTGLFRIGDTLVGIGSRHVGELLRRPALRPAPFHHAAAAGLCEWRGRVVPVVDLTGPLGALASPEPPDWICIVVEGELALGVLVREVVGLHAVPGLDGATSGDGCSPLVRQEISVPAGIVQVLDIGALLARYPEACLGVVRDGRPAATQHATAAHPYAVFEAAGRHAARIDHVQEIVPIPAALRPRLQAGHAVSLAWRGHAVPVRDRFGIACGAQGEAEARQLIIIEDGEDRRAVPIKSMTAMIAPRTATLSRMRVGARSVEVVSTTGPERASYEVVDLRASAPAIG